MDKMQNVETKSAFTPNFFSSIKLHFTPLNNIIVFFIFIFILFLFFFTVIVSFKSNAILTKFLQIVLIANSY